MITLKSSIIGAIVSLVLFALFAASLMWYGIMSSYSATGVPKSAAIAWGIVLLVVVSFGSSLYFLAKVIVKNLTAGLLLIALGIILMLGGIYMFVG